MSKYGDWQKWVIDCLVLQLSFVFQCLVAHVNRKSSVWLDEPLMILSLKKDVWLNQNFRLSPVIEADAFTVIREKFLFSGKANDKGLLQFSSKNYKIHSLCKQISCLDLFGLMTGSRRYDITQCKWKKNTEQKPKNLEFSYSLFGFPSSF